MTAVHKANIMKLADGLFLESCREVATKYPGIKYNEIIVDNCCMQLVSKPEQFDVMVGEFSIPWYLNRDTKCSVNVCYVSLIFLKFSCSIYKVVADINLMQRLLNAIENKSSFMHLYF